MEAEAEGCLGGLIAYVIFLAGTFITRACQRSSGYCSKLFSSLLIFQVQLNLLALLLTTTVSSLSHH